MAGTGPLPLLVVVFFCFSLLPDVVTTAPPSECRVKPFVYLNVKNSKTLETTFWGNIKNSNTSMTIKLKKTEGFSHFHITLNLTHVDVREAIVRTTTPVSVAAVSGPVCTGWRWFRLFLRHSKILTLTDEHNITWINSDLNSSVADLNITVDNFNSSCSTLTPMWHVGNGETTTMTIPSAQQDDLRMTLVTEVVCNNGPMLLLDGKNINLGNVLPGNPLHLRLRQTPGAVLGEVSKDKWKTVIEIGDSTSVVKLKSYCSIYALQQQLRRRACPPPAGAERKDFTKSVCVADIVLPFMWTAAGSSVVTFCCFRKILQLPFEETTEGPSNTTGHFSSLLGGPFLPGSPAVNRAPRVEPRLRPLSTDGTYEEVDVPSQL